MRVKIEERASLPFIKFVSESGEHYALLDTGTDNNIGHFVVEGNDMDRPVTITGFSGDKLSSAGVDHVYFELNDIDNGSLTASCDVVLVPKSFFSVFEKNELDNVELVLGMNFFNKYQAKIDLKNKVLILK